MNPDLRSRFTQPILDQGIGRYHAKPIEHQRLMGTKNYVYLCSGKSDQSILRFSHSSQRSLAEIEFELKWTELLHSKGMRVSAPIKSNANAYVETIGDCHGGYFFATAHCLAPGKNLQQHEFTQPHFYQWGALVGEMHHHAKAEQAINTNNCRRHWYDEEQLKIAKYLPHDQTQLIAKSQAILRSIDELSKNTEDYGLVHGGPHRNNIHFDNTSLTVFDFDDMHFNWFISDIAAALYYFVRIIQDNQLRLQYGQYFLDYFIEGYASKNFLSPRWIKYLNRFMQVRHMQMCVIEYDTFRHSSFQPNEKFDFSVYKKYLVDDTPIIDLQAFY